MDQSITNPEITNVYNSVNNMLMNPSAIIILIVVLIIYFILFKSLGGKGDNSSLSNSDFNSNSDSNSSSSNIMLAIIIIVVVVLVVINGVQYFFGTDIIATVQNLFTNNPEIDILVNNPSLQEEQEEPENIKEIKIAKQVFNIPGNNYVYPDAKALCTAYGGRLATYQEVEQSYNKGGEWCNYGWSDGQMALFPTQQTTYDELQQIPEHENDCGRPGINGGYMANPALKFGVNCYGYKPVMTQQEEELMQTQPHYPRTLKDIAMEKRVNYWKDKLNEILVSPFNYKNWSKI